MMWVYYAPMCRLAAWSFLAAFVVFTVQGLRNRPGPRWLAIAGVPALGALIMSERWRISAGCYTTAGLGLSSLWAAVVSLMFLHHAFQRRTNPIEQPKNVVGFSALAGRAILQALVLMPIAWSILDQFRYRRKDQTGPAAIIVAQDCLSWATACLAVLGVAVGFSWLVARVGRTPRS